MAGMPPALIQRANEILQQLEDSRNSNAKGNSNLDQSIRSISNTKMQLSIFDAHTLTFSEIRNILEHVDINRLTPVEALLKLQEIKGKIG
jgi:DNA mismatch repair protein MutS